MIFKSKLTRKGEAIFKGGNIEPMSKALINFEADNLKKAKELFSKHLNETLGSSMLYYFEVVEATK